MKNRIKELRNEHGLSVRALAARLNAAPTTVSDLENGKRELNTNWMLRLSKVFSVSPEEVAGWGSKWKGFSEDAEPYGGDTKHFKLKDTEFTYVVKSNCLNQIGISPGDILIVDMSPSAFEKLKTGDVVIAQVYRENDATTILRQFLNPNILVSNSSEENAPVINTSKEDVAIKGVVTSSTKKFQGEYPNGQ